jgi:hypothetical protein
MPFSYWLERVWQVLRGVLLSWLWNLLIVLHSTSTIKVTGKQRHNKGSKVNCCFRNLFRAGDHHLHDRVGLLHVRHLLELSRPLQAILQVIIKSRWLSPCYLCWSPSLWSYRVFRYQLLYIFISKV